MVDTKQKRGSAMAFVGHRRTLGLIPGGGITQGDRQQICGIYRGILAAEPVAGVLGYIRRIIFWLFGKRRKPWKL